MGFGGEVGRRIWDSPDGQGVAGGLLLAQETRRGSTCRQWGCRGDVCRIAPAAWPGSGECTLELEDAGGAKLRVHLKGFEAPDLTALSRSFWQIES